MKMKLTESKLKQIVAESVNKVLNENNWYPALDLPYYHGESAGDVKEETKEEILKRLLSKYDEKKLVGRVYATAFESSARNSFVKFRGALHEGGVYSEELEKILNFLDNACQILYGAKEYWDMLTLRNSYEIYEDPITLESIRRDIYKFTHENQKVDSNS